MLNGASTKSSTTITTAAKHAAARASTYRAMSAATMTSAPATAAMPQAWAMTSSFGAVTSCQSSIATTANTTTPAPKKARNRRTARSRVQSTWIPMPARMATPNIATGAANSGKFACRRRGSEPIQPSTWKS